MLMPDKGEEICRVDIAGTIWLVQFDQADDELASVTTFCEEEAPPSESNVHWDRKPGSFDEVPEDLPPKVKNAIYRWMRERFQ